jgi:cytochrome c biogenesis protein CcmG, thiol:disulfide interchange protein DsbE
VPQSFAATASCGGRHKENLNIMAGETSRRALWAFLPAALFAGLAIMLWRGLDTDPSHLPSTMIGKAAPEFALDPVAGLSSPGLASADLKAGRVSVVNIFASWCVPCRDEHPVLMELAKRNDIQLVGIDNKDAPEDAGKFIQAFGNPYARIGADQNGRVSIDWGGYGVPETFVVDGKGNITYKFVGPLTPDQLTGELATAIEKAKLR